MGDGHLEAQAWCVFAMGGCILEVGTTPIDKPDAIVGISKARNQRFAWPRGCRRAAMPFTLMARQLLRDGMVRRARK